MADMSRHRILHVISSIDPRGGGTTTAAAGLAEAQHHAGLDVTLAATHRENFEPSVADRLREVGVKVSLVGPARTSLAIHPQIKPVLQQLCTNMDVVHIHGLWEEIQHRAAVVARHAGVPYIISPHGMLDPWSLSQSKLKKKIYMALRMRSNLNHATALSFTTETERILTEPLKLQPPAIVETLGLDLNEFDTLPEAGTFRQNYPAIGDRTMLLFLSRVHHKKGLDLLIPAFVKVKDKDAMLVIAGPDSADGYQAKVQAMAVEHGVSDRVIFTGMLFGKHRIEAMADADLFILPSYQENFGIVVIEALAAATPVIISDQVNMHHDVTEGDVGEVVPTKVDDLSEAINRWLDDDAKRIDVAQRARPFVWGRYDWKQIGQRWAEHYTRLLGARSA
jgi:glycosyltransferase involved in cell wall biosynthesis